MTLPSLETAQSLMRTFGDSTGLTSNLPPRRYLWTDAYAVCNYLALSRQMNDPASLNSALKLVAQVHEVLGKHRADDPRQGWISGLDEAAGQQHPTAGGLRIGKSLPQRPANDPEDAQAEWDRDGQYFHYLTKWAHALHQVARFTHEVKYFHWACELMVAAVGGFCLPGRSMRLAWKMSVDLQYPLVSSSGHHDPLDGLVTIWVLLSQGEDKSLQQTAQTLISMCHGRDWRTDDALGIGGLLFDVCRLAQIIDKPDDASPAKAEIHALLSSSLLASVGSLEHFLNSRSLQYPASQRLGFRELGLSIGLKGIPLINRALTDISPQTVNNKIDQVLQASAPIAEDIEQFWLQTHHRRESTWTDHRDISDVMLASSLLSPAMMEI